MRFGTFLLRVDGVREAELEDFKTVVDHGPKIFQPEHQRYLYVIETEIIENRFFWMSCEYDDAVRFRNYVVDSTTGEREPNPRKKSQVEPRQQFFACYDTEKHILYASDLNKRAFLQVYLEHATQKKFYINNVYASVDEFCARVKSIRGFHFIQVDNMFARQGEVFNQISDIWGVDAPNKIKLSISYPDIPIHGGGRGLVDRIHRDKNQFENVIIIGCDDDGVEQTFDFSSIIKRVTISPFKDDDAHYDSLEVKTLLLAELR